MTLRQSTASLLFLAAASVAFANGSRLPSQDALAVARGDAYAATADDPSAVYYNPAGLGQEQVGEVESGLSLIAPTASYQGPGGTASLKSQTFALPYIYADQPVPGAGGLVVGLGFYSPFGLATNWPVGGPFRTVATSSKLTFLRYAVSAGYDFHNGFLIGASVQDNSLKVNLNRGLGYVPGDNFNYTGSGDGAWSYNVGVIYRPTEQHSFGITFQSRATLDLSGTVSLSPPVSISGPGTLQWAFPQNIDLGYSFRPTPDWNFEVGVDRTDWSVLKTITLQSAASGPVPIVFDWKDSNYYEAGLTRYFHHWLVSGGITYSGNSVNDNTWSPSLGDYTKVLWNLGLGYKLGSWDIESALQYSPSTSRTVGGTPPSAAGQSADGTYKYKLWAFMLQTGYHW